MSERNYVVYVPTPLGKGIIVAVFTNAMHAKEFISTSETELAMKEIEVDGDTSIRRYMDYIKEGKE